MSDKAFQTHLKSAAHVSTAIWFPLDTPVLTLQEVQRRSGKQTAEINCGNISEEMGRTRNLEFQSVFQSRNTQSVRREKNLTFAAVSLHWRLERYMALAAIAWP